MLRCPQVPLPDQSSPKYPSLAASTLGPPEPSLSVAGQPALDPSTPSEKSARLEQASLASALPQVPGALLARLSRRPADSASQTSGAARMLFHAPSRPTAIDARTV